MLGIKPQQLSDRFNGHCEPTADRVLQIQELIKTKPARRKRKSIALYLVPQSTS
jgi:hypothetical protein